MSTLKAVGRWGSFLLMKGLPFCSVQVLRCLDEAHSHYGGQSAFLSLLIPVLISSENTLTDTPRIMLDQISGYLMAQSS